MKPEYTLTHFGGQVSIGNKLIDSLDLLFPELSTCDDLVVITEDTVWLLYADRVVKSLEKLGPKVHLLIFPPGENSKIEHTKAQLDYNLLEWGISRNTVFFALGGGVVGDLAGFVASTYLRGVPVIHLPTTLLAMVDSSIGGKTGINTDHGKNLIGTFWKPKAIVASTDVLQSLDEEQMKNGFVEALKMFWTFSEEDLNWAQAHQDAFLAKDSSFLTELIHKAMSHKIRVTETDFREKSLRESLNFGHTIGHALELQSDYQILHGFAVALGMLLEAKISELSGHLKAQDFSSLQESILSLGISLGVLQKSDSKTLWESLSHDKKNKAKIPHMVYLTGPGQIRVLDGNYSFPIEYEKLEEALSILKNI